MTRRPDSPHSNNPFTRHEKAVQDERGRRFKEEKERKLATGPNYAESWEKRPLLCRLHHHRPVVWLERYDTRPPESAAKGRGHSGHWRKMPSCGRCGYEWDAYF